MVIKAILFDFGQTLADSADGFRTAERDVQNKICENMGLAHRDGFLAVYRKIRKDFHAQSRLSRVAMWQAVYRRLCRPHNDATLAQWEKDYWDTVKSHTILFPETVAVLRRLRQTYRLSLITNSQGQMPQDDHRACLFPELEEFFEVIVVAGEGGLPPKPASQPFEWCLKQMNLTADEALYVGDEWQIDICGARNAGIQPVWLQHMAVQRNWPAVETTEPVITGLEELFAQVQSFGGLSSEVR